MPITAKTPTPARSGSLDGVRALAALGVLVYHCSVATRFNDRVAYRSLYAGAIISNLGQFCVCIFFALSGYLLFREFLDGILFDRVNVQVRQYLARRFLRIYPAYWAALLGFVLLIGAGGLHGSIIGLVTLTEGSLNRSAPRTGLGVSWTLYIEVAFYVMLPILCATLRRVCLGRPLAARVRIVTTTLLSLVALSMLWVHWAYRPGATDLRLKSAIFTYLTWLVAGMLLALLMSWHSESRGLPGPVRWLSSHPWLCWAGALALNLLISMNQTFVNFNETRSDVQIRLLLQGVGAFLILVPLVFGPAGSRLPSALGTRWIAGIGVVSYGVYLWHETFIQALTTHVTFSDRAMGLVAIIAIILPSSLLVGWISHRFLEKPMLALAPSRVSGTEPQQQPS